MLKAHEHDQNCLQTDLTIPNNIIQVQNFHENQITREPEFQSHERKAFLTNPIMSDQAVKPGGLLEQELEVLLPFVFSSCDKCANRKCTCHNMCILLTYMHKMHHNFGQRMFTFMFRMHTKSLRLVFLISITLLALSTSRTGHKNSVWVD